MRGIITKSEKILLFCTVLFLLLICGACFYEMSAERGGGTVETITSRDMEDWLPAEAGRININTATVELLKELPGIGDALAARIVEYRETNGRFDSPDQIMEVKGIGEKTYRNIEEMITVEGAAHEDSGGR